MLFGKEVIVLDDEMIAGAGELKGFVGDPKSFCAFFDRKQTSVEWVDNQIYGKLLAGIEDMMLRKRMETQDSISHIRRGSSFLW